ncbi:hypothetical protein BDU57DRAFT_60066 [Ampelomyces quisqualis]|uniref:Uncharacterized protein n=1 Tax=Ampelomyces quisqualis TaxID=50730 RepID=A0A6A5R3I2_AMPQU|nr:hypothetical protein BDU57DRAFT_60066 [Ampelomyces quisqualis]
MLVVMGTVADGHGKLGIPITHSGVTVGRHADWGTARNAQLANTDDLPLLGSTWLDWMMDLDGRSREVRVERGRSLLVHLVRCPPIPVLTGCSASAAEGPIAVYRQYIRGVLRTARHPPPELTLRSSYILVDDVVVRSIPNQRARHYLRRAKCQASSYRCLPLDSRLMRPGKCSARCGCGVASW